MRKPQHLPTTRASGASPEVINAWFNKVESVLKKIGLAELAPDELKHYIWNCDETGFCTVQSCKKILAKRGDKNVQDTLGGSGRNISQY